MKRYALCLGLVFSAGCAQLKSQFNVGDVSVSDAVSVGSDLYNAASLSDDEVIQMAHDVAKHYDSTNKIAPPSSTYAKRLTRLVSKYQNEDGLKLNYKVYLSPEVNAFSLADGTVRVYSGLMDKMTDDELLFVIGHEIGHVKNGHGKVRMQRAYAASAATRAASAGIASGVGSSVGGYGAAIAGDLVASMAADVIKGQFSQGDETESDEYGLQFLNKGGYQPAAAVVALTKLGDGADDDGGGVGEMFHQFTSTHPDPLARAEHIRSLIPGLPAAGSAPPTSMAANDDGDFRDDAGAAAAVDTSASAQQVSRVASPDGSVNALHEESASESGPLVDAAPSQDEPTLVSPSAEGWVIQVGSFSDKDRALKVVDTLLQQSRPAQIEEASFVGGTYSRVIVGPYPSRNEAMQRLVDLSTEHSVAEGAFVRRASN
jgi:putative metalloprotease